MVKLKDQFHSSKAHLSGSSASQYRLQEYTSFIAKVPDVFGKARSTYTNGFLLLIPFLEGYQVCSLEQVQWRAIYPIYRRKKMPTGHISLIYAWKWCCKTDKAVNFLNLAID